jgi:hypothetical protein
MCFAGGRTKASSAQKKRTRLQQEAPDMVQIWIGSDCVTAAREIARQYYFARVIEKPILNKDKRPQWRQKKIILELPISESAIEFVNPRESILTPK